jgi:hypothetical protein
MAPPRWSQAATWSVLCLILLAACSSGDSDGGDEGAAPAPTANAGGDETVAVGVPVTLDGSASESPTGIPVSYQWTLSEKPASSTASLTNPTSARPTFTPDIAGSYTPTLVVEANGVSSLPDSVSITAVTGNVAPRANAGPDASAAPGRAITLDGSASRDPNNTTVTYRWRIVEQPPGSHPTLTNATSWKPTFTADVAGRYVLALICSDGTLTSTVDHVVIIVGTGNLPPVANAGPDQTVTAGQVVTLDGRGSSDPNGDPLTYSWCLKGRPQHSTAILNGPNTARPSFTPDVPGSYVLCLTVNDGRASSAADTVVVEARLPSSVGGVLQAYVKASNTTAPQFRSFGGSVALDGDTLAVRADEASCATGVNGDQTNSGCPGAGAVYVFTRIGDTWSQQAYLKASNTELRVNDVGDDFGASVSLSGDTLAVGAPQEDSCASGVNGNQSDNGCIAAGAVYVFSRTGSTWSQQAYVKASNPRFSFFGRAVAIRGNTLVVGADDEDGCATGINGAQMGGCLHTGAVYIFTRSNDVWTQQAYVKASAHNSAVNQGEAFGFRVALDGDTLAVSAPGEDGCISGINGDESIEGCNFAGAVYVFTRTAGAWTQQAYLKASNTNTNTTEGDQFGSWIALKGNTLVVSAFGEDSCASINGNQADEGCPGAGAVYVFTRNNNVWIQEAYVKASHPGVQTFQGSFGLPLAFDGTTLAVSAGDANCARGFNPSLGSNDCVASGAVYLFTRTATSWAQRAYVKATNTDAFDFFGGSIAIDGNTLAVGAGSEDSCATGINGNQSDNNCQAILDPQGPPITGVGAVYVYELQ